MRMNGNLINTFCIIFFFLSKKVINALITCTFFMRGSKKFYGKSPISIYLNNISNSNFSICCIDKLYMTFNILPLTCFCKIMLYPCTFVFAGCYSLQHWSPR